MLAIVICSVMMLRSYAVRNAFSGSVEYFSSAFAATLAHMHRSQPFSWGWQPLAAPDEQQATRTSARRRKAVGPPVFPFEFRRFSNFSFPPRVSHYRIDCVQRRDECNESSHRRAPRTKANEQICMAHGCRINGTKLRCLNTNLHTRCTRAIPALEFAETNSSSHSSINRRGGVNGIAAAAAAIFVHARSGAFGARRAMAHASHISDSVSLLASRFLRTASASFDVIGNL